MIVDLKPRVVELGKIKIGRKGEERTSKKGNAFRAPEKQSFFTITGLERDSLGNLKADDKLMSRLIEKYGTEDVIEGKKQRVLRELPIAFLDDEIENVFQSQYVAYSGRKCVGRSDGETITWLADPKNSWAQLKEPRVVENKNNYVQTAMVGEGEYATRLFKPHGTLNVVIADGEAKWGGVYKFRTTSIISIEQIYGGLHQILALTGGFLRNVPLRMVVRPMEVTPKDKATTVYVVHVELRGADLSEIQKQVLQLASAQLQNRKQLAAVQREYVALLKAPGEDEDEDEQADVVDEFHPEVRDVTPAKPAETTGPAKAPIAQQPPPAPEPTPAAEPAHEGPPDESAEERLIRSIDEAQTEAHLKVVQASLDAMKPALDAKAHEELVGRYYAARERITGKPVPDTHPSKGKAKRTPPPPPPRAVQAVTNGTVPPPAAKAVSAEDIPF